jgi:lipopolysaccharide export LptBFGC system permease protein LptF
MRFSRTLFWYVLWDLLKVFGLASGALAGIMSFGGLLRPLTQNGLDGSQVALLLEYFMPAMSTYSLPIAALFATTVVYGRMAADNEITACRASGIDCFSMTVPAAVLGLLVAVGSMYLMCFTVPQATMKIEQVIYSNLAGLIAHQIEQTHETHFDNYTVFAQSAVLQPVNPAHPLDQAVVLNGPLIVSYEVPKGKDRWFLAAKEFWSASSATAIIHEEPDDPSATTLAVQLNHGAVFPRVFNAEKSSQGAVERGNFGPIKLPSRIEEKTKFMNIFQLRDLQKDPSRGQEVQQVLTQFIKEDQAKAFRQTQIIDPLRGPGAKCELQSGTDTFVLTAPGATFSMIGDKLVIKAGSAPVKFQQESDGEVRLTAAGSTCELTITTDPANDLAFVAVKMNDAVVDAGDSPSPAPFSRKIPVNLPPEIASMKNRTAGQYLNINDLPQEKRIRFALYDLIDHIRGELHMRAAFVVSCFLLVFVGSSLGMMFRSGNFLNAFAVSVFPAMLSTVLIVTGQHTAEATPQDVLSHSLPLNTGIAIMWSGNVIIFAAAVVLMWRLQRR